MQMKCVVNLLFAVCALLGAAVSHAGTCFAFDDTSGSLVVFDQQAPLVVRKQVPIPGGFGGDTVESAYFDGINNRYYLIAQFAPNSLGYIDPLTDTYVQVSPATGLGTPTVPTTVPLTFLGNDTGRITGLTRNPVNNKWYVATTTGFLIEINPTTGVIVPGAFSGNDYLILRNAAGAVQANVEDIVFDATGKLHVSTGNAMLRDISLTTGFAAGQIAIAGYIEGLSLDDTGLIRGVSGENNATNTRNVYFIDPVAGTVGPAIYRLPNIGAGADYESLGCNALPERSDLELFKTASPASVVPGGTASFVISIFNRGVDPAFRVEVLDSLPPGVAVQSSSIAGTCTSCSFDPATGIWSVNQILLGQRLTLTVVVSTAGVTPNSVVTNRAQVNSVCTRATGLCVPMPDFDSVPGDKAGAYTPTDDDEAQAQVFVTPSPSVGKAFIPSSGEVGSTATLVLTLTNPNTVTVAALTANLVDAYPSGVVNAAPPNATTTCGGAGALVAPAGGTSITVPAGRSIPAGSSCVASVVVRFLNAGPYANTVPAGSLVTSVGTSVLGATATYVADPVNQAVVKTFTPGSIGAGQTATLRLTLSNPSRATATLTSVFTDEYPPGLVNGPIPNPQTSCLGAGGPTAAVGGTNVSLPTTRAIAPLGSCTITVVVTAASFGNYTNTVPAGSLTTNVGSNAPASQAVLEVNNPYVIKTFTPASVQPNTDSVLTLVFVNPRGVTATFTSLFTDLYPAGIVNAPVPGVADTCAVGNAAATAGAGTVTMSNGTQIPPLSQCQLTVNVRGAANGVYVNTIPAGSLTTNIGPSTSGVTATLTISTLANLQVTKVASTPTIAANGTVGFTVVVSNLGPSPVVGAAFSDGLNGLVLSGPVVVTGAGGGTATARVTTTTSINATLTLPVNGTVSFSMVGSPTTFNGFVTNTASVTPPPGVVDPTPSNNNATATVLVTPRVNLGVTKTNGVGTLVAGTTTLYTIVFNNNGPSAADGALIRDVADANLVCTSLTCNTTGGAVCGAISTAAFLSPGGHSVPVFPAGSTVTVVLSCGVKATGLP